MDKRNKKVLIRIILTILFFLVVIIAVEIIKVSINEYIQLFVFICIYLLIGYDIVYKAVRNVFNRDFLDENFLMSIASICAFFVSEYTEAIAVMLLYQIGELFQRIAVNNSRKSISDLVDICPEYANVINLDNDVCDNKLFDFAMNEVEIIDSDEVQIGSIILIKVGERVPLDCIVLKGQTFIDQSALTGESVPIKVQEGDIILSGGINTSNVIIAKTVKEYDDSTATKILELVENASDRKSRAENFISRFAKYYTPIVVGLALVIALLLPIILRESFGKWIGRACIFLITSCPCALVISVPLSFFGGIGTASKRGILIKGSNYIEALSKVDTCVFDKTGTLTKGEFKVCKVYIEDKCTKEEFFEDVYMAEKYSNHPIAEAILKYIDEENCFKVIQNDEYMKNDLNKVEEIPGKGIIVRKECSNDNICLGNYSLMNQFNVSNIVECNEVGTVVYVSRNTDFLGYILIKDELKESSKELIKLLNKFGINKIAMLTGDKKEVGENIAKELGLWQVHTQLYPEDKVNVLEKIMLNKDDKGTTLYVGDGINDAPVLARADVGISMGGVSSDAAIEASDIVLMDDNLLKIIEAIIISKRTMTIVRQNIVFSLTIKAVVLILGAIGIANMWMAIFADVGLMVLAILNAIRVRGIFPYR